MRCLLETRVDAVVAETGRKLPSVHFHSGERNERRGSAMLGPNMLQPRVQQLGRWVLSGFCPDPSGLWSEALSPQIVKPETSSDIGAAEMPIDMPVTRTCTTSR
jgi:hypothetical protein